MGLRPLEIFLLLQRWDRRQIRRQTLVTKVDPGAARVKYVFK